MSQRIYYIGNYIPSDRCFSYKRLSKKDVLSDYFIYSIEGSQRRYINSDSITDLKTFAQYITSTEKKKVYHASLRKKLTRLIDFIRLKDDVTTHDIIIQDREFDKVEEYLEEIDKVYSHVKVVKTANKWMISPYELPKKYRINVVKYDGNDLSTDESIKEKDCCICFLNYQEINDIIAITDCCQHICCRECFINFERDNICPCCRTDGLVRLSDFKPQR